MRDVSKNFMKIGSPAIKTRKVLFNRGKTTKFNQKKEGKPILNFISELFS